MALKMLMALSFWLIRSAVPSRNSGVENRSFSRSAAAVEAVDTSAAVGFSAALAVGFFGGGAFFGVLVLMPLYFEIQRGQSTVATGLLLIGQGVGAALTIRT